MVLNYLLLAGAAVFSTGAHAQGVYRCGNTFSERPCGPDAKQIMAPPMKETLRADTPPSADVIAANLALCERVTRAKMKDPESAKITPIGRVGPAFMYRAGKRVQGVAYHIAANGKNSYGGYTGEKLHVCGFDAAEQALIFSEETDKAPR